MSAVIPSLTPLKPHPAAPARAVGGVSAGCSVARDGRLRFAYRISAPPPTLHWDREHAPGRRDELWRHTCCEAFVATGPESYLELNVAPDGSWAVYGFSHYRRRADSDPALSPPDIRVHAGPETLGLVVDVDAGAVFDLAGTRSPRIGLACVLRESVGSVSYWALHHPLPEPDFHHAGGFVFTLSPAAPPTDLEGVSA